MSRFSRWLISALLTLLVACVGAGIGFWLGAPTVPAQLQPSAGVQKSPVSPREVDDSRQIEILTTLVEQPPLRSASVGLVTGAECLAGKTLSSGDVALSVDGRPVVAFNTAMPLWRSLDVTSAGDDVRALQQGLADLGYDIAPDGKMGEYTLATVAHLLRLPTDEAEDYQEVDPSSFVWLPAAHVDVESCPVAAGTNVEVGTELFTLQKVLSEARVKELPADLVDGPRSLVIDAARVAVDSDGVTRDKAGLADLQATATFVDWLISDDESMGLRGRLVLTEPATVYSLAPAAVYQLEGNQGCVFDGDQSLPVTVVSSELGQTFVSFTSGTRVPDSVEVDADEAPACR